MSTQAHIPQPDGSLSFDSTQSPPETQPSQIQTPPMPTLEVQAAAGEGNMLDPYFYEQEVKVASVVWTTSDPIGKELYELDLSPLNLYPLLAYFCRPYHAWGGSFIIMLRVFASGFHCGFIKASIYPPGYKRSPGMSISDATVVPWVGVDAKQLDCISILCRDMRPIKYHLMKAQPNDPMDLHIGGRLLVTVDSPLSTASTGVQKVNIGIWAKLERDFRVSFLLPITVDTPLLGFPEELLRAIAPNESGTGAAMCTAPVSITTFVATPAATVTLTTGSFNSVTFDGEMRSKLDVDPKIIYPSYTQVFGDIRIVDNKKISIKLSPLWDVKRDLAYVIGDDNKQHVEVNNIKFSQQGGHVTCETVGDNPFKMSDKVQWLVNYSRPVQPTEAEDNPTKIPNKNESFFMYAGKDSESALAFQTEQLARLLVTERYRGVIPRGQCAMLRMLEKSSGLPLTYVKMYPSGIMTVPANKDQVTYEAIDKVFVFDAYVVASQPFPQDSQMAANRYAYLSYLNSKRSLMN